MHTERAKAGSALKNELDFPIVFSSCDTPGFESSTSRRGTLLVVRIATETEGGACKEGQQNKTKQNKIIQGQENTQIASKCGGRGGLGGGPKNKITRQEERVMHMHGYG